MSRRGRQRRPYRGLKPMGAEVRTAPASDPERAARDAYCLLYEQARNRGHSARDLAGLDADALRALLQA